MRILFGKAIEAYPSAIERTHTRGLQLLFPEDSLASRICCAALPIPAPELAGQTMDSGFWHERWNANQIAFHQGQPKAMLERHFNALKLTIDSRVLVPLRGTSTDII